ncbi:hypothetical protein COOONC_00610 [Cooperia oncophora]
MDLNECRTEAGVESLRKRVEDLGNNSLRAASSRGENDGPALANNGISTIDLDAIDPRILKHYAERRLKKRSQNSTVIGHRRVPNFWIFYE